MKDEDEFAVGLNSDHLQNNTNSSVEQPSIVRLGILLLLFDVYLTWARIERQSVPDADSLSESNFGRLAQQPIVLQYMFFRASPSPTVSH